MVDSVARLVEHKITRTDLEQWTKILFKICIFVPLRMPSALCHCLAVVYAVPLLCTACLLIIFTGNVHACRHKSVLYVKQPYNDNQFIRFMQNWISFFVFSLCFLFVDLCEDFALRLHNIFVMNARINAFAFVCIWLNSCLITFNKN